MQLIEIRHAIIAAIDHLAVDRHRSSAKQFQSYRDRGILVRPIKSTPREFADSFRTLSRDQAISVLDLMNPIRSSIKPGGKNAGLRALHHSIPAPIGYLDPMHCSYFVLMAVETLGEPRAYGWRVIARCAAGKRDGCTATRNASTGPSSTWRRLYGLWAGLSLWHGSKRACAGSLCGSRDVVLMFSPSSDAMLRRPPKGRSALRPCLLERSLLPTSAPLGAAVAQPVEHRIRNAGVGGSNPFRGTILTGYAGGCSCATEFEMRFYGRRYSQATARRLAKEEQGKKLVLGLPCRARGHRATRRKLLTRSALARIAMSTSLGPWLVAS